MLRSIISVTLFLGAICWSQKGRFGGYRQISDTDTISKPKVDKKKYTDFVYALRIGVDLSKPVIRFISSSYNGIEFVGDFRIRRNIYIAGEYGRETRKVEENTHTYTGSGNYRKIGMDFNFFGKRYYLENLLYGGFRYAQASFSQNVEYYRVYIDNTYWGENSHQGENTNILGDHTNMRYTWIEVLFGAKAELFKNIFLGASVRFCFKRSSKDDPYFPNQWVPGFGYVVFKNPFSANFNYTITYRIPIIDSKKIFRKRIKGRKVSEINNEE